MATNAPVPDSLAVSQLGLNTPALGLESIVSKRFGSRYVSGRTRAWLKTKTRSSSAADSKRLPRAGPVHLILKPA
jgi:ATP-dependent DNA ligase